MRFMNSLDTNILIYAVNSGCVEHERAKRVYESMLRDPSQWVLSDQVLFEFYRGLRSAKILERPLNHQEALRQIEFLRVHSGVLHCAYETAFWDDFLKDFRDVRSRPSHIFDRILAITLRKNGVSTFYTRNTKDFAEFGFKSTVNPIDQDR
jgi:toxin-antitoxin system PIN domain toxin